MYKFGNSLEECVNEVQTLKERVSIFGIYNNSVGLVNLLWRQRPCKMAEYYQDVFVVKAAYKVKDSVPIALKVELFFVCYKQTLISNFISCDSLDVLIKSNYYFVFISSTGKNAS